MNESAKIELYKLFRAEKHKSIDLHLQTFKHFLTLITVISGATIAGLTNFQVSPLTFNVILLTGSFLVLVACIFAMKTCDLFYRGMLEGVSVMAKLEISLGLNSRIDKANDSKDTKMLFPNDEALLPQRWIDGLNDYSTSQEFIDSLINKGSNHHIHIILIIFRTISIVSLFWAICGMVIKALQLLN